MESSRRVTRSSSSSVPRPNRRSSVPQKTDDTATKKEPVKLPTATRQKRRGKTQAPSETSASISDALDVRHENSSISHAQVSAESCSCQIHFCDSDNCRLITTIRENIAMKLHPKNPGCYEDTLVQVRADEDWSVRKSVALNRPQKSTSQCVIGKIIEYGIVAGLAIGVFVFVSKHK